MTAVSRLSLCLVHHCQALLPPALLPISAVAWSGSGLSPFVSVHLWPLGTVAVMQQAVRMMEMTLKWS